MIENLMAAFPAVPNGQLYYRELEKGKIKALSHLAVKFDSYLPLTDKALVNSNGGLITSQQARNQFIHQT